MAFGGEQHTVQRSVGIYNAGTNARDDPFLCVQDSCHVAAGVNKHDLGRPSLGDGGEEKLGVQQWFVLPGQLARNFFQFADFGG